MVSVWSLYDWWRWRVSRVCLAPVSITMPEYDDATIEAGLIGRFVTEKMEGSSMTKSAIVKVPWSRLESQIVKSEVHKTENFEYYLSNDPKVNGKSNMRKAFCEPGNANFVLPSPSHVYLLRIRGSPSIDLMIMVTILLTKQRLTWRRVSKGGALHPIWRQHRPRLWWPFWIRFQEVSRLIRI